MLRVRFHDNNLLQSHAHVPTLTYPTTNEVGCWTIVGLCQCLRLRGSFSTSTTLLCMTVPSSPSTMLIVRRHQVKHLHSGVSICMQMYGCKHCSSTADRTHEFVSFMFIVLLFSNSLIQLCTLLTYLAVLMLTSVIVCDMCPYNFIP